MQTERLLLIDIETGERLRSVDLSKVSAIKASIAEIGLRTPITVSALPSGSDCTFRLVAGAHRLEALRQLGEEFADCFIMDGDQGDADLWEIDENFARAELTDAQRADHHLRRKAILEAKGVVRTRGGDRRSSSQDESLKGYAEQAAETLGVGKSSVHRDLHRATSISPDVLADVSGTDLDKGVVLDELARTPQPEQRAKLAEITLRRQEAEQARKDAERVNKDTDRVIALTDAEQFADWLHARTDLAELPTIISWLEGTKAKDVIAALRRQAS